MAPECVTRSVIADWVKASRSSKGITHDLWTHHDARLALLGLEYSNMFHLGF